MRKLNLFCKTSFNAGMCSKCSHRMLCATSKEVSLPLVFVGAHKDGTSETWELQRPPCLFRKKYTPIILASDAGIFPIKSFNLTKNVIKVEMKTAPMIFNGTIVKNDDEERKKIVLFMLAYASFCILLHLFNLDGLMMLSFLFLPISRKIQSNKKKAYTKAQEELSELDAVLHG